MEGLLGIKHIQQFPKAVFHLQNGLTIFKYALRPAGDRRRVYCLGGSLRALQHFHQQAGSESKNILFSSSLGSCVANYSSKGDLSIMTCWDCPINQFFLFYLTLVYKTILPADNILYYTLFFIKPGLEPAHYG